MNGTLGTNMATIPELDEPIIQLAARLRRVDAETVPLTAAFGRILAQNIVADRDSPAADVSAMDGYGLRFSDLQSAAALPIVGRSVPGHEPPPAPIAGSAIQIFTGAVVPTGTEVVVRREDTTEAPHEILLSDAARRAKLGENIRRQGENITAGATVIAAGRHLDAPQIAAAANFGASAVVVRKPVRITILTTGDELKPIDAPVTPWQLRDSNGPTLAALLSVRPYLHVHAQERVADEPSTLVKALREAFTQSDAVILTGGVSAGDFDFVPAALQQAGGTIAFHKLPIRPGRPIMAGTGPEGQLVLGLPGNPVSAAVCALRFGLPLLRSMAGAPLLISHPRVLLDQADEKTLHLHWFRLVTLTTDNRLQYTPTRGSGDLVSLSQSSGFVHLPPGLSGAGPWSYWSWND